MYEPKIIGFLCTWCSYTGADTAGISRLKYPSNMRAIRVPCSGRVAPEFVLRAFDQGADGVLVLGCHIGECHYDNGNHRTAKRLPILTALMEFVGLEPGRLRLDWVSSSEGERFARIVTEFTETVRALGPSQWRANGKVSLVETYQQMDRIQKALHSYPSPKPSQTLVESNLEKTKKIRDIARELLLSEQVGCVLGYEVGPRGRTRPSFVYKPEDVDRLVWNQDCTHNLVRYLRQKLHPSKVKGQPQPVGIVVKPCDSRAINVLLAERQFEREQVYVIGVVCDGILQGAGFEGQDRLDQGVDISLQQRCVACNERVPSLYDVLVGEPYEYEGGVDVYAEALAALNTLSPQERASFWMEQFDRCIRCYACRQACPMCNCPTCLFERDDSLWVGMGIRLDEKRTFHLGRAYHLAGRCVGCNECERVCPMDIPISLLNRLMAGEIERNFGFRAGLSSEPSPLVTVLSGWESTP